MDDSLSHEQELIKRRIGFVRTEWEMFVGDIGNGRENFGEEMPVQVYRLFEFTMKHVLTQRYGKQEAIEIFRESGFEAGMKFAKELLHIEFSINDYMKELQAMFIKLKMGILRIEKMNHKAQEIVVSIREDLDCSGLPVTNETVCNYDEGFIKGILYAYTKQYYDVRETDCWAKGGRVCRFEAKCKGDID